MNGNKGLQQPSAMPSENSEAASSESREADTMFLQKTLRSGQSVSFPGNIVIMGDVNPGAEVVAGGNIIVFGRLRGVVHAGAKGNDAAVIAAFSLQPLQIRIGNYITRAPDEEDFKPYRPEIARIQDKTVIIERFQSMGERYATRFHA